MLCIFGNKFFRDYSCKTGEKRGGYVPLKSNPGFLQPDIYENTVNAGLFKPSTH